MADRSLQYQALANPTRRSLLEQLRSGPRTVAELAAGRPVSRPAVSQHLKLLTDAGLTTEEWSGNFHYYRIDPRTVQALRRDLESLWDDALQAFARHIEDTGRHPKTSP